MFCGCILLQAPRYKFYKKIFFKKTFQINYTFLRLNASPEDEDTCLHDFFTLMILPSAVIARLVSKQRKPPRKWIPNDLKNKWQTMIDLRGWLNRILVIPMNSSATSNEKPISELHREVDSIQTVYNCILVPPPLDCRLCLSAPRTSGARG